MILAGCTTPILILLHALTVVAAPCDKKCLDRRPLDELIQHFEPVHYDLDDFGHRHRRAVGSVGGNADTHEVSLKFHAHDRHFHLRLKPDTSDLASNMHIEIHGANGIEESIDYDPNSFLVGHVEGDDGSYVSAFNDNGIMSANIHCSHGSYYLKPARDHLKTPQTFHSVIYRKDDISPWPISMLRNETMRKKLEKQSLCGVPDEGHPDRHHLQGHDVMEEDDTQQARYFQQQQQKKKKKPAHSKRTKRAGGGDRRFERFVCTVSLYADYHFFTNRARGDKNVAISVMRQHVNKAINIFSTSDFDQDSKPDGFQFKIGRIQVITNTVTPPFTGSTDSYHRPAANGNKESVVRKLDYLAAFSAVDGNKEFCEAISFTYIDFPDGLLGLAYLQPNGICAGERPLGKPLLLRGNTYTKYVPNTGFVTFLNHGIPQNDGVTEIVFAHELGHNWGSNHDAKVCTPGTGSSDGNYLMFDKATDGTKRNNGKFSTCSLRAINSAVVRLQRTKSICFSDDPDSFCGNKVVEEGEECDCGTALCDDPCCSRFNNVNKTGNCKVNRTLGYECSPSRGECCTSACLFRAGAAARAASTAVTPAGVTPAGVVPTPESMPENATETEMQTNGSVTATPASPTPSPVTPTLAKIKCGSVDSCQVPTFCSATKGECEKPVARPNGTICTPLGVSALNSTRRYDQACFNGFCSESVCRAAGLSRCSCGTTSCQVCCMVGTVCTNTHNTPVTGVNGVMLKDIYLPPGAPCNNYNGQCDQRGSCKDIDLNTALNGINSLFDAKALNVIVAWLKANWFWLIVIVVVIAILAVAVHFTYKWKQTHEWSEGKALAKSATMRIGKSMRGPRGAGSKKIAGTVAGAYEARVSARRMGKMFPTAGYEVLIGAAKAVDNEEAAVVKVLDQGFKMCRW